MGKKDRDIEAGGDGPESGRVFSTGNGRVPAFSVGDILAVLILLVLSAALLLEGYYSGFKEYSKEIIALFAIVAGFLLGRKT